MSYCTKCGFLESDCHCDLRAFLAEKRTEDGIVKFLEQTHGEAQPRPDSVFLHPHEEAAADDRLREIAQQCALGHAATARDTYWAASVARGLLEARRAIRDAVVQMSDKMREHEAKIAQLQQHLHGTP